MAVVGIGPAKPDMAEPRNEVIIIGPDIDAFTAQVDIGGVII